MSTDSDLMMKPHRAQWSSRWAFILAATGSAVGLGNIWKFPYMAGDNGGSAFVLIYLGCILLVGIPVMMAELVMGRHGHKNPLAGMRDLIKESKSHGFWQIIGWGGGVACIFLLSFYSVIAGWSFAYTFKMIFGEFAYVTAAGSEEIFNGFVGSYKELLLWHSLFMLVTGFIVSQGVRDGLERAVQILMPLLVVLLVVLISYSARTGFLMEGIRFLFTPDFSKVTGETLLSAMGHAFFTLSIGMVVIMAYASYLSHQVSIPVAATNIAIFDTVIALMAGIAIFPIVFAFGLNAGQGPGLVFVSLPVAFGNMAWGQFFGSLFFLLLFFAALTSSISLMEPVVSWLEERFNLSRLWATLVMMFVSWTLGIGSVLSFNVWSEYKLLDKWTFFDGLDFLTANILLPFGGVMIALFAGWCMQRDVVRNELGWTNKSLFAVWHALVRYVAPFLIICFAVMALLRILAPETYAQFLGVFG